MFVDRSEVEVSVQGVLDRLERRVKEVDGGVQGSVDRLQMEGRVDGV
jgi:hypothetical protein